MEISNGEKWGIITKNVLELFKKGTFSSIGLCVNLIVLPFFLTFSILATVHTVCL